MRSAVVDADLARIADAPLPFEQFDGARVLITGANGFLPAYLVETLLRHFRIGHLTAPPVAAANGHA